MLQLIHLYLIANYNYSYTYISKKILNELSIFATYNPISRYIPAEYQFSLSKLESLKQPSRRREMCVVCYYLNFIISLLSGTTDPILNLEKILLATFSDFDFSP